MPGETTSLYWGEEEMVEYLTALPIGWDREEAQRAAKDTDLWINDPAMRFGFEDEEAVRQWRAAAEYLRDLVELCLYSNRHASWFNEATIQALDDAHARAMIACARAKERVRRAREEA